MNINNFYIFAHFLDINTTIMQRYTYHLIYLFIASSFFLASCKTKKDIVYTAPTDYISEELLDTLVITDVLNADQDAKGEFRSSATMLYDILHTSLDLAFDWNQQHVLGKATLTIKPYFRPIVDLSLDAVGFDIHEVKLLPSNVALAYSIDDKKLHITLNREYTAKETFQIYIDYTAKPNQNPIEGSEAITSDKGLFFINPLGEDPEVPMQIWTQGETENNSRWFPTFDKPIERFTQEISLTVDDKFITLSNGKKISSTKNPDGTRTDHWKQDKPHAPYLAMIAVGEFAEEMDTWNNIPLHYVVEKGFKNHAKKIFNHTPEMLQFFSKKLDYMYPWDKYAQIVVRDFVSGAMENTSAVIFGDFIQKTDRELIDNDNDYIVAHEMMHHWFGDLVTCEDWSNLTLNEGFANYAEYLWFENKYGKDRAEYHRMNEMNGYFGQVFGGGAHPLIHYYYEDKEEMFDAHSYNKGGLVLHMLRDYLGDQAFFAGLHNYLVKNAYTAVEVDELRIAFEDTIGEDLHWFFDQWFEGVGHPHLDVTYTYNDINKILLVEVDQSNTPKGYHSVFTFPVSIAVYYADGTVTYHPQVISQLTQRILIEDLKSDPVSYVFDGKNVLLALINENKTFDQYKAQFMHSPNFMDKIVGFTSTGEVDDFMINKALKDDFYMIRSLGVGAIADSLAQGYIDVLQEMALLDKHSEVRKECLIKLLSTEDYDPKQLCIRIVEGDQAYPVLQVALEALGAIDPVVAQPYVERFKADDSDYLASTMAGILDEKDENLDYLEDKAKTIGIYQLFDFYSRYNEFLTGKNVSVLQRSTAVLSNIAGQKDGNMFRKYLATLSLIKMAEDVVSRPENPSNTQMLHTLKSAITKIVTEESNPTLIEKYQGLK